MGARRFPAVSILSLAALAAMAIAAAPAGAQMRASELVHLLDPAPPATMVLGASGSAWSLRTNEGDLRSPGPPRRNGLIAALPVRHNVRLGIGRFSIGEIARPRTNMEAERHPMVVRPRERGIAAVGISFSF